MLRLWRNDQLGKILLRRRKVFGPYRCCAEMPGYFYDARRDSLSYVPDMLHNAATLKKWGHFEKLKTVVRLGRM